MKIFLSILILLVSAIPDGWSQANPAIAVLPQGPPPMPMFVEDITGRPFNSKLLDDIEGSPFLLPDWNWGAVKFKNGKYAKDIELKFNVYNNQLFFKRGEEAFEFVLPVNEFMIGYQKEGDSVAVLYRNGFPDTERTNGSTFFELLTEGKFQLLKYRFKELRSFKPYNQSERKQFADNEQLYVYASGSITKIKKDKESVMKALPQYAEEIRAIVEREKLKLKSEADLVKLFFELNKK